MILTIYTATTMIIIAYLLGSIPSAVWIGKKYYGIDIREYGSKNAGTTNMLRVLGRRAAAPVFALDFLKGFVAVTIIELMQYDVLIGANDLINLKIGAVFAAVLGHIFPIFAGFRGGKGVATLVGAVTGIYPPVALLCFGVWLVVLMIFHYVSLASIIAGCCFPAFTLISPKVNGSIPFVIFSFVIAILLIYTHRKNIERLKAGTESKIYVWKPRRVKIVDGKVAVDESDKDPEEITVPGMEPEDGMEKDSAIPEEKVVESTPAAGKTVESEKAPTPEKNPGSGKTPPKEAGKASK